MSASTEPKGELAARFDLECAISDAQQVAWIASHLEAHFHRDVSREKPGVYLYVVDRGAAEALTWSIYETKRRLALVWTAFEASLRAERAA